MTIRFGLFPPIARRGGDLGRLFEEVCAEAQVAEECGFDACLIGEHHQQPVGYITSPLIMAAALAARTRQLRVGTGILLFSLYHPVRVAEDAALVDVISGGRLILGLGLGYQPQDFNAFGIPLGQRLSRFEEGMQILRQAWTQERFSFSGRHYNLREVSITPKPLQKPHPPLWLGAWSEPGVVRAARWGDAWLTDPIQNLPTIKRLAAIYREEAQRCGKKPRIVVMRDAWVGATRELALEEYGPPVLASYRYYWQHGAFKEEFDPWVKEVRSKDDLTLEKVCPDRVILGSPEECVREIERYHQEIGADYFVLAFRHPGGPSHERAVQAIRLFGEMVLPYFARQP